LRWRLCIQETQVAGSSGFTALLGRLIAVALLYAVCCAFIIITFVIGMLLNVGSILMTTLIIG
jgi:hypothetical protein